MLVDKERVKKLVKELLEAIGEDPTRPDLVRTPERIADLYSELLSGMEKDPEEELIVALEEKHDEIVLLKDISFYSLCEHHLLPFFGKVHIAYLPKHGKITGLSKLVKVVEILSRRLQVQERMTTQIAEAILRRLEPLGVMVVVEAEHLCMSMRGVNKPGAKVITSAVRGIFRENAKTRNEVLSLLLRG